MNRRQPHKLHTLRSLHRLRTLLPRLWPLLVVLVVLVVALGLTALTGSAVSDRDEANRPPRGQVQAAAADPEFPDDATATVTEVATAISTETATEEPDPEETSIVFNTIVVRPTRTRAATATRVSTAVFTMIAATHIAHATNVTARRQELRTRVALTHAPTITPGAPPALPSPTPIMGMLPGCGNISSNGPQAFNCWRGVVDGDMVEVFAGREGRDGDRTQGIIRVHVRGQQGDDDIYQTPQRVGAVRIASVDGLLFTLETMGQPTPVVFVFDLDTRQWVAP